MRRGHGKPVLMQAAGVSAGGRCQAMEHRVACQAQDHIRQRRRGQDLQDSGRRTMAVAPEQDRGRGPGWAAIRQQPRENRRVFCAVGAEPRSQIRGPSGVREACKDAPRQRAIGRQGPTLASGADGMASDGRKTPVCWSSIGHQQPFFGLYGIAVVQTLFSQSLEEGLPFFMNNSG
jgi:hypothetical protein